MSAPILTFAPKIDPEAPAWLRQHLTLIYQKLGNHTQAMQLLSSRTSVSPATAQTVQEIINASGGGGGSVAPPPPGGVNNQSGVTAYTTVAGDNGLLIVLSDASPIAVSLTTQTQPWFAWLTNQGAGTATLTPVTGTISFAGNPAAASMPLDGGYSCLVAFDGTNWWAWTEPAAGGGGTITAVVAGTGLTGGGSSGSVTLNLGATAVTPGSYTSTNLTVNAEGQITAASNGSGGSGLPVNNPTFTGVMTGPQYVSNATSSTAAVGAAAGSGGAASFGSGSNDVRGVLVVTVGTGSVAGILATVTLGTAFANPPLIQLTATSASASTSWSLIWAGATGAGSWQIEATATLPPGTYDFTYFVIG